MFRASLLYEIEVLCDSQIKFSEGGSMLNELDLIFHKEKERYIEDLKDFLRIPSVSGVSNHIADVRNAAQFLASHLKKIGFPYTEIVQTSGNPIVFAEWIVSIEKPTVFIYGHYDVQPVGDLSLWVSPPFEPEIRNGNIYARGASDNKGQLWIHITLLDALVKAKGILPFNVKIVIDGEEEIGSPNFLSFLKSYKERLDADFVLISDTAMLSEDQPSVCVGLRGLLGFDIIVDGPSKDLPSGLYGGAVQNPIHALIELLQSMKDKHGRITINDFYNEVVLITNQERKEMRSLHVDDEKIAEQLGVPALFGEFGFSTVERQWVRPTIEVNGISGGNNQTIIPSRAVAHVTCRLVPNQRPEQVFELIQRHVLQNTPAGVRVTLKKHSEACPYVAPINHPVMQLAKQAYTYGYGKEALWIRAGGSIPVVEMLAGCFGIPIVLMGFGLPTANVHGPNEHFPLTNFEKGWRTLSWFFINMEKVFGNL